MRGLWCAKKNRIGFIGALVITLIVIGALVAISIGVNKVVGNPFQKQPNPMPRIILTCHVYTDISIAIRPKCSRAIKDIMKL
jgi:hypothetical protein